MIQIWTDGASEPTNPGPSGYGFYILFPDFSIYQNSGGFQISTNQRMELFAAIAALVDLDPREEEIRVFSDSMYLIRGMTNWVKSWKKKNWRRKPALKNVDLWKWLDELTTKKHMRTSFHHVKGHSGIYENELVDRLANEACTKPHNPPDPGYQLRPGQILYDHTRFSRKQPRDYKDL
jgi:ribonuclease HI